MKGYSEKLLETKKSYPFGSWMQSGLEQYTEIQCAAFAHIFDRLIESLINLGESATEEKKLNIFKEAVEALNSLNAQDDSLIETGEREELCELVNTVTKITGLNPTDYGDGEGPASEWRDW